MTGAPRDAGTVPHAPRVPRAPPRAGAPRAERPTAIQWGGVSIADLRGSAGGRLVRFGEAGTALVARRVGGRDQRLLDVGRRDDARPARPSPSINAPDVRLVPERRTRASGRRRARDDRPGGPISADGTSPGGRHPTVRGGGEPRARRRRDGSADGAWCARGDDGTILTDARTFRAPRAAGFSHVVASRSARPVVPTTLGLNNQYDRSRDGGLP